MIEVWQVSHTYSFRFHKLMADKVTDLCVIVNGSRVAKSSDGTRYFMTFADAKEYALTRLKNDIVKANKSLAVAEENLRQVTATTPDTIKTAKGIYG